MDINQPLILCVCKLYVQCVQISTMSRCRWTMSSSFPLPPFFEETSLAPNSIPPWPVENCYNGRVALHFRFLVKLDKKCGDGRSVPMDCCSATIKCLSAFAPGWCYALGSPLVCIVCTLYELYLHKVC